MISYASISSIGSHCQAARQLRRAARDVITCPLDWVFADRLAVLTCIERDFDGLCDWDNLVITADLCHIQDRYFGVDFFHQFPREPDGRLRMHGLRESRLAFKPRLDHLVENFRAIQGPHLFVWVVDAQHLSGAPAHDGAREILAALRQRKPGCDLLVVQDDVPHEPPWADGPFNRYTAPTPGVWEGDDLSWDAILAEFDMRREREGHASNPIHIPALVQ